MQRPVFTLSLRLQHAYCGLPSHRASCPLVVEGLGDGESIGVDSGHGLNRLLVGFVDARQIGLKREGKKEAGCLVKRPVVP